MTICRDGLTAEGGDDFIECWLAGFDQFAGQCIGIDYWYTQGTETIGNRCFAAANAAGQTYYKCLFVSLSG